VLACASDLFGAWSVPYVKHAANTASARPQSCDGSLRMGQAAGRGLLLVSASMDIELVAYDDEWTSIADAACAELRVSLPGLFTDIEHIGSTSVPGLVAKPIIDLIAGSEDLAHVVAREETLRLLGYEHHDTGMPGRLFYRRNENGRRAYHLHVIPATTWATRNERLLRDYLRAHPADARRYGDLKRELAARHVTSAEYTRGKTGLIQELTDRARAARGLPSVPVWEE